MSTGDGVKRVPISGDAADLRAQLSRMENRANSLAAKNDRLTDSLNTARKRLLEMQESLASLTAPPHQVATLLGVELHSREADVMLGGRRMRVSVHTAVPLGALRVGEQVRLNGDMVLVAGSGLVRTGESAIVKEHLADDLVLAVVRGGDERVIQLGGELSGKTMRLGDAMLVDMASNVATRQVLRSDLEELVLEEQPDTEYSDIGGLGPQIEQIRDTVELPFMHPDLYREHGLRAPKGVLLYGPPGCGKTLIAKAVATSLARQATAETDKYQGRSFFLNIKGPELLNKYVGETERQIRVIFDRAREKAAAGIPVVIFFDEMEALFRTRGTGRSSDVETTVVPQLLAEIDGVEKLENVIVIGASNREDMIDPAILRPGRLDVKIRIERPDADGAREIMAKYLTADLPLHEAELEAHGGDAEAAVRAMIDATVDAMYERSDDTAYLEVTYADGGTEVLYVGDFASGAMIVNIVDRAKKAAIKSLLSEGERGISTDHLLDALADETAENEHLPSAADPEERARVSGRRGERVTSLRSLQTARARRLAGDNVGNNAGNNAGNAGGRAAVNDSENDTARSEAQPKCGTRPVTDAETGGLL